MSLTSSDQPKKQNIVMDVRQKLMLFARLEDYVRRLNLRSSQVSTKDTLQKILDASNMYVANIVTDSFSAAWNDYVSSFQGPVKAVLQKSEGYGAPSASSSEGVSDAVVAAITSALKAVEDVNNILASSHSEDQRMMYSNKQPGPTKPQFSRVPHTLYRNINHLVSQLQEASYHFQTNISNLRGIAAQVLGLNNTFGVGIDEVIAIQSELTGITSTIRAGLSTLRRKTTDTRPQRSDPVGKWLKDNPGDSNSTRLQELLTVPKLYEALGPPLVQTVEKVEGMLASYIKSNEGETDAPHLEAARDAQATLDAIALNLMLSVNEDKRIPQIDEGINRTLNNAQLGAALHDFVPLPEGAPAALHNKRLWSSLNKAAAARVAPKSTFLYRAVDPVRVMKYLDQIKRFQDTASKAELGSLVAMQGKRMQQMNSDLVKQANVLRQQLDPPVGQPENVVQKNVTEATIRIRQLQKRKKTLIESYVRSVKTAVISYTKQMIAFVNKRHGEAIRYMAYWEQVGKGGVVSAELRDAIQQHNRMVQEVGAMSRQAIMDYAYVPFGEAVTRILSDADASVLSLEDNVTMALESERDQTLVWMEKQADRVHGAFIRGSPDLLDDVFEPQQLVLWGLKALRIAVAAISLDVAKRAYQSVYHRRVHVLDDEPPSPSLFVAMFLAVDAAFHLVLLAVLFTLYKMFKAPDNMFPVDMDLISMWSMDYVACTAIVALISLGIGVIIKNKRYFRFRYEGDRAIKAFAKMALYVYIVAVLIPFYRLTFG